MGSFAVYGEEQSLTEKEEKSSLEDTAKDCAPIINLDTASIDKLSERHSFSNDKTRVETSPDDNLLAKAVNSMVKLKEDNASKEEDIGLMSAAPLNACSKDILWSTNS